MIPTPRFLIRGKGDFSLDQHIALRIHREFVAGVRIGVIGICDG